MRTRKTCVCAGSYTANTIHWCKRVHLYMGCVAARVCRVADSEYRVCSAMCTSVVVVIVWVILSPEHLLPISYRPSMYKKQTRSIFNSSLKTELGEIILRRLEPKKKGVPLLGPVSGPYICLPKNSLVRSHVNNVFATSKLAG